MIKIFFSSALATIFSWRLVIKEVFGVTIAWSAYLLMSVLIDDPAIKSDLPASFTIYLTTILFWITVVISVISLVFASIKSALPAAIALLLVMPLYFLGFVFAAKILLLISGAATFLYVIGFAHHGGYFPVDNNNREEPAASEVK